MSDIKLALLNFTGPNYKLLEYGNEENNLHIISADLLKAIFDNGMTFRAYLTSILTPEQLSLITSYYSNTNITQQIKTFVESQIRADFDVGKNPTTTVKAVVAYFNSIIPENILDITMRNLGIILVRQKTVGGFEKDLNNNVDFQKIDPLSIFPQEILMNSIIEFYYSQENTFDIIKLGPDVGSQIFRNIHSDKFMLKIIANNAAALSPEASAAALSSEVTTDPIKEFGRFFFGAFHIIIKNLIDVYKNNNKDSYDTLIRANGKSLIAPTKEIMAKKRIDLLNNYLKQNNTDIMFLTEFWPSIEKGVIVDKATTFTGYTLHLGNDAASIVALCNAILIKNTFNVEDIPVTNPKRSTPETPCVVKIGNVNFVSIHTGGTTTLEQNNSIISYLNDMYTPYILGIDANTNLTTDKLVGAKLLNNSNKNITINNARTVFQTQLDKSPLREYGAGEIKLFENSDQVKKDFIISNLQIDESSIKKERNVILTQSDGTTKDYTGKEIIPTIAHQFDHTLIELNLMMDSIWSPKSHGVWKREFKVGGNKTRRRRKQVKRKTRKTRRKSGKRKTGKRKNVR